MFEILVRLRIVCIAPQGNYNCGYLKRLAATKLKDLMPRSKAIRFETGGESSSEL